MADKFINPYNFINFPAQKAKAYTDTDRHTGVIKYSITTESPLLYQIPVRNQHLVNPQRWRIINLMTFFPIRN